jgi:hypothetical protein
MDFEKHEKCPKRDSSTTLKTAIMTRFFNLWLIITPKPFTSRKEAKKFPSA